VLVGDTVIVRSLVLSATALALVAACGGSPAASVAGPTTAPGQTAAPTQPPTGPTIAPTTAASTPTAPTTQETGTPPPVGGGGTTVHVVVGSGPLAGTYDATGPKADCNVSPTGSGASYSDLTKTDGVDSLIFTSVGGGGANPTSFYFQVLFAPFSLNQDTLEIDTLVPSAPKGHATAFLEDDNTTIKWTINGSTKDDVPVMATIECGPVDRPSF
jgi:hypothetical protein